MLHFSRAAYPRLQGDNDIIYWGDKSLYSAYFVTTSDLGSKSDVTRGPEDIIDDLEKVIIFLSHFKHVEALAEGAKMTVVASSDP